jgi:hypothetical protein
MHEMAPGLRAEPQAGQVAGAAPPTAGIEGKENPGIEAEETGWLPLAGVGTLAPEGGIRIAAPEGGRAGGGGGAGTAGDEPIPATTGCRCGAPMMNVYPQRGQVTCLPTDPSGTCIGVGHFGQWITNGMVVLKDR